MKETKAESIDRMVKLIEAIHHVAALLQPPAEIEAPYAFQPWVERTRKMTAQFEFELRTELGRLGAEISGFRKESSKNVKAGLELASERYRQALNCTLTAHARAMLTRQAEELRKTAEEFSGLSSAA